MTDLLERRFNGPVPRALVHGAAVGEARLRRRQALARARTFSGMAGRARADVAALRRAGASAVALEAGVRRLRWARAEAEVWRAAAAIPPAAAHRSGI